MAGSGTRFGFRLHQELDGCLKWAEQLLEAGFTWVEVQAPNDSGESMAQMLGRIASSPEVTRSVHSRFYGISLASLEPGIRDVAVGCAMDDLHWAASIGASTLVVHAGEMHWYDFPPEGHPCLAEFTKTISRLRREHLHAASESIAELAGEAKEVGVLLAIENLYAPWELLCAPSDMTAFLDTVSPNVACALDIGHASIARNNPMEYLALLDDRIKHVHVHANDGLIDCHWAPVRVPEQSSEWVTALAELDPLPPLVMEVPTFDAGECIRSMEMLERMVIACKARRKDSEATAGA